MAFKVGQEYRTNSLSKKPGGKTVIVVKHDYMPHPRVLEYDNIKNSYAFIKTIIENDPDVKDAYVKE